MPWKVRSFRPRLLYGKKTFSRKFRFCALLCDSSLLFEDLYEWAGKPRTVDISKKGTQFCPAAQIESTAKAIFARLKSKISFVGLDRAHFISAIVDFYERTNELHPFREGNGRTQRVFFRSLPTMRDMSLILPVLTRDDLMIATIQAAGGVDDF